MLVAFAAYWFIHNYPETAGFLSDKERKFILHRLASDSDATRDERFTWDNVAKALLDPKCWLYGLSFHTMSLPLYTFSLFLVSVLSRLALLTVAANWGRSSQQSSKTSAMRRRTPNC